MPPPNAAHMEARKAPPVGRGRESPKTPIPGRSGLAHGPGLEFGNLRPSPDAPGWALRPELISTDCTVGERGKGAGVPSPGGRPGARRPSVHPGFGGRGRRRTRPGCQTPPVRPWDRPWGPQPAPSPAPLVPATACRVPPMRAEPEPLLCRAPPPALYPSTLTRRRGRAITRRGPAYQGRRSRGRGWAGVPAHVCDVITPTRASARPRLLLLKRWTHHGGAHSAAWRALPRMWVRGRTF